MLQDILLQELDHKIMVSKSSKYWHVYGFATLLCWLGAEKTNETKRSESGHEKIMQPSDNEAILNFSLHDLKSAENLQH